MNMSEAELLAELASRGETVADIRAAFDRIHAKGVARLAAQRPKAESAIPLWPCMAIGPELVDGLAFHAELACAGRGLDGEATGLRRATLADLFGRQDWEAIVAVPARGASMEGVGINDGDTLLVDCKRAARDGDIVVVHLAGRGQLIKRLRVNRPFGVALESAHPDFEPILVEEPDSLTVHGVVVGRGGKL